jgi:hypothetical protein
MKTEQQSGPQYGVAVSRLVAGWHTIKDVRDAFTASQLVMTPGLGATYRNPYSGVGDVVRNYGNNLNAAMRQLKTVERVMQCGHS